MQINKTGYYEAQINNPEKLKSDYLNLINDLCFFFNEQATAEKYNLPNLKDSIEKRLLSEIQNNKLHLLEVYNIDRTKAFQDLEKFIDY